MLSAGPDFWAFSRSLRYQEDTLSVKREEV